jgi:hypothetical protein
MAGVDCEYVSEYAKDRVWQEDQFPLRHCQLYITGKQCLKVTRLLGKVDVIVTDSPIMLGAMYTTEKPHQDVCIYEGKKYPNTLNLYIDRRKGYNPNGRNQSYAEALEIDRRIIDMLDSNDITYYHVDGTEAGYEKVVETIIAMLGKTTGYSGLSAINNVSGNNTVEEAWKAVPVYEGYCGSMAATDIQDNISGNNVFSGDSLSVSAMDVVSSEYPPAVDMSAYASAPTFGPEFINGVQVTAGPEFIDGIQVTSDPGLRW